MGRWPNEWRSAVKEEEAVGAFYCPVPPDRPASHLTCLGRCWPSLDARAVLWFRFLGRKRVGNGAMACGREFAVRGRGARGKNGSLLLVPQPWELLHFAKKLGPWLPRWHSWPTPVLGSACDRLNCGVDHVSRERERERREDITTT